MRILVSGGAGFIGSKLAMRCKKEGIDVCVLDNFLQQIHGEQADVTENRLKDDGIHVIKGDVRSKQDWLKSLQGVDCIVHLASETGTGQSMYEIERYTDVNVRGTAVLLDILINREAHIKKIINASSRAIYGEGRYINDEGEYEYPEARLESDLKSGQFECRGKNGKILMPVATDEESLLHPASIYGITKLTQEQMILSMSNVCGYTGMSLRLQNVFGPGQSLNNPYTGILSVFSGRMLQSEPINIFEDGEESRDFVYIDDVVEAMYRSLVGNQTTNAIYNVGTGIRTKVIDVAHKLKALYRSSSNIEITGNYRVGDIRHNFASIDKAKKGLGFVSRTSFDEGLEKFSTWVRMQDKYSSNYEISIEEIRRKGLLK